MRDSFGAFLFKHRGLVPVLPVVLALAFARPVPPWTAIGIAAMAAGEAIRLWGTAHLGGTARSRVPQTGRLVTRGPYAHTRHPLYWGNFLLTVGFATASGAWWPWFQAGTAVLFVALYGRHAVAEEKAFRLAQGERYEAYAARVPRWLWRLKPAPATGSADGDEASFSRASRVEAESLVTEALLLLLLWVRVRIV